MKNLIKLFICAFAMVAFAACSSSSSPSAVSLDVKKCLTKADFDGVVKHFYFDKSDKSLADVDEAEWRASLASMLEEKSSRKASDYENVKSFEVVEEIISEDGNSATVKIKTIYNDDSENVSTDKLFKQDGKWYLDISK